jgi:PAS domain S-box-containing protein
MKDSTQHGAERGQADAEIQRRLQEMTLLHQITTVVTSATDMTEALYHVCAELAHHLQVPQAGIAILNRQRTAAEVVADYHPPDSPSAVGAVIPVAGNPSMEYVLKHKAPLSSIQAQADPRLAPIHDLMRQRNVQSILIVPILAGGEVIGTLGLDALEQREFSAADVNLVRSMTAQVGQLLLRKRATDALRESEKKFRTLAEQSPGMIFINVRGRVVYANRYAAQVMGYKRKEFYAKDFGFLTLIAPEYRDLVRSKFRQHLSGEEVEPYEYALIAKDGRRIEAIAATSLIDYGGERAILGVATDVTERKRLEERARQRAAQLEALRTIGLGLTSELDLDALLNSVVSQAVALLRATVGGLYLYRHDRDVLEWAVGVSPNAPSVGTILHRGEGLSGSVWQTGQYHIVDDYQQWEGLAPVFEGRPTLALLGVPVRWGEELLGVINVGAPPPRTFSPADAELLDLFATQAAIAIRNAQFFQIVEQAKRDWEVTFDTMQDAIALVGHDRRIVRANRAFARLVGKEFSHIIGQAIDTVLDEAICPVPVCPSDQTLENGQPAICTHEFRGRTLEVRTAPMSAEARSAPGHTACAILILRDITERQRMEQEREDLIHELQDALARVETLSGLLPMCANCKRIQDDQGHWHSVEVYVKEHSRASFSHGICPDCMKELYPWFDGGRG